MSAASGPRGVQPVSGQVVDIAAGDAFDDKRALLTRFSRDGADCETLLVIQPFDRARCAGGTVVVVAPGSTTVEARSLQTALLVARLETQSL